MDWFGILEAARNSFPDKFTTFKFQELLKFSHIKIASAWICKFVKWGYVERVGSEDNPGHKPIAVYAFTQVGRDAQNTSALAKSKEEEKKKQEEEKAQKEEELSDLDKLRDAVRAFEGARNVRRASMGKKTNHKALQEEDNAFLELLALCDELDKKEYGVD